MSKGEDTRTAILDTALAMSRSVGLEGVTIGALASRRRLSKSGVFAHFGSKEELQLAVLQRARESFTGSVLKPALGEPRGVARIRALYDRWVRWSALEGGCPMISAVYEFDDRPGAVRELVARTQRELRDILIRAVRIAVDCGDLAFDTDAPSLAFQIYGLVMATHVDSRLLDDPEAATRGRCALDALIRANAPRIDS